jgi:hypothetical protein
VFEFLSRFFCETTYRGSLGYCYSLLSFLKCREDLLNNFVLTSLTKPECLDSQTGVSGFGSSNSTMSFVKF